MVTRTDRRGSNVRYFVRFFVTALLLVAATLLLVLVVLPQRYVLSVGFAESGQNFPDPSIPFLPHDPVRVAVRPPPPPSRPPPEVTGPVRGPAEIFWSEVMPLLEQRRYDEALPLFERYLREHDDDDVRREHARTLAAAGRGAEAVPILEALVDRDPDPELRLTLARILRDLGRADPASVHYRFLLEAEPGRTDLALEWATALAWLEEYDQAEAVLRAALDSAPDSPSLRLELARVYYFTDRLAEALAILEAMSEQELEQAGAEDLLAGVRSALATPPPEIAPGPSGPPPLLQRAVAAREADDFDLARDLFEQAVRDTPEDGELWLAYANLLEYELDDFEGARRALLEVERLNGPDGALQLRIARLEAWTGRNADARSRLLALLDDVREAPAGNAVTDSATAPVSLVEARSLLGDVSRWGGDRVAAARYYGEALDAHPGNSRALEGSRALREEVERAIVDEEAPRVGGHAFGLGDTDGFGRADLAADWVDVEGSWVWRAMAGHRWLSGPDRAAPPSRLRGAFVEVSPARWWRQGTIRTGLRLGAQRVRDGATDLTLGAALGFRGRGGSVTLEYAHEPAYDLTATLQSAFADVYQDRLRASLNRPLGELWSLSAEADLAVLDASGVTESGRSTRALGAVSVSRSLSRGLSLGWTASALTYSNAAPAAAGLRLYWDPAAALSSGPVFRLAGRLSEGWEGLLRVSPGFAVIDERTASGYEGVPQLSAEARVERVGPWLRSSVDLFYAQSRLEGYRTYGVRVSLGAAGSGRTGR